MNRDYCTFWANFPLLEPPWIRRGGAGVKIKDCLENGAGICRNEELIEGLLAALRDIASGPCCETPGCCVDDPKCEAMMARAAIAAAEAAP